MSTHPALELLFQAYLHQDWPDEYGSAWAAVDDFLANEPRAAQLPDEVTALLAEQPSDDGLREAFLDTLDSGYLPEADGFTVRDWLTALRERAQGASHD
jgi:hypothetical protein